MDGVPAGVEIDAGSVENHGVDATSVEDHGGAAGPVEHDGDNAHRDESHRGVAVLLGLAAILAAVVGVRATVLSSDASDTWQSALRTEVKRSAGALEDIRYLYQSEVPPVVTILGTRLQEAELRAAAATETGAVADTLTREADVQANVLTAIAPAYELATHPAYALPGGGVNLGLRLSDVRNENPRPGGAGPRRPAGDGRRPGREGRRDDAAPAADRGGRPVRGARPAVRGSAPAAAGRRDRGAHARRPRRRGRGGPRMIEPEVATRWRSQGAFDRTATLLIGTIAVLAALLAILQVTNGLASTRAQAQAARLSADVTAKISASSLVQGATLGSQQGALVLGMEAVSTLLVATRDGDAGLYAVGTAKQAASGKLTAALAETAATSGADPVDPYTAGLLSATIEQLNAEVAEQNRQVDLANEAAAAGSGPGWPCPGSATLAGVGAAIGAAGSGRGGRVGPGSGRLVGDRTGGVASRRRGRRRCF